MRFCPPRRELLVNKDRTAAMRMVLLRCIHRAARLLAYHILVSVDLVGLKQIAVFSGSILYH